MGKTVFTVLGEIVIDDKASKEIDLIVEKAEEADKEVEKASKSMRDSFNRAFSNMRGSLAPITQGISGVTNKLSQSFSDLSVSAGQHLTSIGNAINSKITKPALAAGTAIGSIFIGKGFNRLVSIDTAKAKLTALGNTAQDVEKIMNNAQNAVKGTAFGLGEAVTVASSAVASGVKAGGDLERYLKLIGSAAAVAGSSFEEMGAIFNKVTTSGIIQAEELNQISDRGIPIFQMLADEIGVTAGEIKALASEGEISSETFLNAIENGFGDAGKIMGEMALTASWDNLWASVSRVGAAFLDAGGSSSSFFSQIKPLLTEATELIDGMTDKATEAGKAFGEWFSNMLPSISEVKNRFNALDKTVQNVIKWFPAIAVSMGVILPIAGSILTVGGKLGGVFATLGTTTLGFSKAVQKGTGGFSKFTKALTKVGKEGTKVNGIMTAMSTRMNAVAVGASGVVSFLSGLSGIGIVMTAIGGIVAGLGLIPEGMRTAMHDTLEVVRTKAPELLNSFATTIQTRLPQLMKDGTALIVDLFNTITDVIPDVSMVGQTLLNGILDGMRENGDAIFQSAIDLILGLAQAFIDNIDTIIELGAVLIQQLATAISENSEEIINMAITIITTLATALWEVKDELFNAALAIITGLLEGILANEEAVLLLGGAIVLMIAKALIASAVKTLATTGLQMLGKLVLGFIGGKGLLIAGAVLLIGWLVKTIIDNWDTIKQAGIDLFNRFKEGIQGVWDKITGWWDTAVDFFHDVLSNINLFDIGSNILNGLWDGLKSVWNNLTGWFGGAMNSLKEKAQSILSIFSPSREFRYIGEMVMKGLGIGLEDEYKNVDKTMGKSMYDLINQADSLAQLAQFEPTLTTNIPTHQGQASDNTSFMLNEILILLDAIYRKDNNLYLDGQTLSERLRPYLIDLDNKTRMRESRRVGERYAQSNV